MTTPEPSLQRTIKRLAATTDFQEFVAWLTKERDELREESEKPKLPGRAEDRQHESGQSYTLSSILREISFSVDNLNVPDAGATGSPDAGRP